MRSVLTVAVEDSSRRSGQELGLEQIFTLGTSLASCLDGLLGRLTVALCEKLYNIPRIIAVTRAMSASVGTTLKPDLVEWTTALVVHMCRLQEIFNMKTTDVETVIHLALCLANHVSGVPATTHVDRVVASVWMKKAGRLGHAQLQSMLERYGGGVAAQPWFVALVHRAAADVVAAEATPMTWSLPLQLSCYCADCRQVNDFLHSPNTAKMRLSPSVHGKVAATFTFIHRALPVRVQGQG